MLAMSAAPSGGIRRCRSSVTPLISLCVLLELRRRSPAAPRGGAGQCDTCLTASPRYQVDPLLQIGRLILFGTIGQILFVLFIYLLI